MFGATPQRDSAVIGFSAATALGDRTSLFVAYDGEIGGGTDNHSLRAGFKIRWWSPPPLRVRSVRWRSISSAARKAALSMWAACLPNGFLVQRRRPACCRLDASTVEKFALGLWPAVASSDRAVFVVDGDTGLVAGHALRRTADRLEIEGLVHLPPPRRRLSPRFAERTARSMALRILGPAAGCAARGRCRSPAGPPQRYQARFTWLVEARPRSSRDRGRAAAQRRRRAARPDALLSWRLGRDRAPDRLRQHSAHRVQPGRSDFLHVVVPAALCAVGTLFALWQILLIAAAARRSGRGLAALTTLAAAAVSVAAIGGLLYDRALPSIAELWEIYGGDEELGELDVSVGNDGTTLCAPGRLRHQQCRSGAAGVGRQSGHPPRRPGRPRRTHRPCLRDQPPDPRPQARHPCRDGLRLGLHHRLSGRQRPVDRRHRPAGRSIKAASSASAPTTCTRAIATCGAFDRKRRHARLRHARAIDTPPDEIWTPSPQELLAGKVVSRINR